jgi:hypothetical protein
MHIPGRPVTSMPMYLVICTDAGVNGQQSQHVTMEMLALNTLETESGSISLSCGSATV